MIDASFQVRPFAFDRVFAINVKSIYLGAVNFVPQMRAKGGGSIVNIASTAGIRPRPGLTWYNGTKGAVMTPPTRHGDGTTPGVPPTNCALTDFPDRSAQR